jgi:hypothetical protein
MINTINLEMALDQKVTPAQHNELNHLHHIMDCVIRTANCYPDGHTDYKELVEFLEYKMQEQWNFTLDKHRHTHWMRLEECRGTTNDQL